MDRISNISKLFVKNTFTKSITKKRNTFWQMVKCIVKMEYKPSWVLILTLVGAIAYFLSPFSVFNKQHILLRFVDDAIILFVVLKVLSHETLRYARFKAKSRRICS